MVINTPKNIETVVPKFHIQFLLFNFFALVITIFN